MNINEFEENLNLFTIEPARAMALVLNMCIKHQALLEGIAATQAMLLAAIEKDPTKYKQFHADIENDLNDRIAQIQAEVASRF